jgi:hypothetical protein
VPPPPAPNSSKCKIPWDYNPRLCARHVFLPPYAGPKRKKPPRQKRVIIKSFRQKLRESFLDLGERIRLRVMNDRRMITTEEMVDRIADEDRMYFRNFELEILQRTYLMAKQERAEVRASDGHHVMIIILQGIAATRSFEAWRDSRQLQAGK